MHSDDDGIAEAFALQGGVSHPSESTRAIHTTAGLTLLQNRHARILSLLSGGFASAYGIYCLGAGFWRHDVSNLHSSSLADSTVLQSDVNLLFSPSQYVEQDGAIAPGDEIWLYAVGASTLEWMTWLDQLHLVLNRLGYKVPTVDMPDSKKYKPGAVPVCDDTKYFKDLETARFVRGGSSSWNFAFDDSEGCDQSGMRWIAGHQVQCQGGWQCQGPSVHTKLSWIADQASSSNVTVLAQWLNDNDQQFSNFRCYNYQHLGWWQTADISIQMLLKVIKAIHERNPLVVILVLGKFPTNREAGYPTEQWLQDLNGNVKQAVEKEPNTFFIDYRMPSQDQGQFYQTGLHSGHPNCRGSMLLAQAALHTLWQHKVLSRSISAAHPVEQHVLAKDCEQLNAAACHTSGFCWLDPAVTDGTCKPYDAGSKYPHYVWNYGKTGPLPGEKEIQPGVWSAP